MSKVDRKKLLEWIDGDWYGEQIVGIAEALHGSMWLRDIISEGLERLDVSELSDVAQMVCGSGAPRDRAMGIVRKYTTEAITEATISEYYADEEDMMEDFNNWLDAGCEETENEL